VQSQPVEEIQTDVQALSSEQDSTKLAQPFSSMSSDDLEPDRVF
jgi:hypothetical protein